MPDSNPPSTNEIKSGVVHLRSLTGLRFVAAFAVFYSHVQHFLFPGSKHLPIGGPAVSFFFVLSGFILTYVYHNRLKSGGVRRFLVTRWARLWPLHVVCLAIAFYFMREKVASNPNGSNGWDSLAAQFLMVHSWLPARFWFTDFNSVSWSISTEMFFYVVFPLLLLGNRRLFPLKLVATGLIAFACLWLTQLWKDSTHLPEWMNTISVSIAFPPVRLFEFALGMGTCLWMLKREIPFSSQRSKDKSRYLWDTVWELVAVALVVVSWYLVVRNKVSFRLAQNESVGVVIGTWFRVAGGLFFYAFTIYTFAVRRGFLGQVMSTRLAVWLGEISFAYYLIHQIVIVQLNFMALGDVQFAAVSFLVSLFAAAILHRVVELPARNALLARYDRKPGWFGKGTAGIRQILVTPTGRFQALALIALLVLLGMRPVDAVNRSVCQKIADGSPGELRNVRFLEEAVLMGVEARRVERGVMIRMAWNRERSWSRKRYIHICDASGEVLRQGPLESDAFKAHEPNQPFVDEVILDKRTIKDGVYIGIGFWSEPMACAPVESPIAEMGGARLKIVDLRELR